MLQSGALLHCIVVYIWIALDNKSVEKIVPDPKGFTIALFDKVGVYLTKEDWKDHDEIKKSIRKEIKSLLRTIEIDKELIQSLPIHILDILENQ